MIADEILGSLADEFHVASRNLAGQPYGPKEHIASYDSRFHVMAAECFTPENAARGFSLKPQPALASMPLGQAILARSSSRGFGPQPLSAEQLATLLFLGNGVRQVSTAGESVHLQRNVPSAGNLGSVEVFPIVMNVADIPPGIYHYDSARQELSCLKTGQFRTWFQKLVTLQLECASAAVALILTCALGRLGSKYGLRGYRLGLMDVGHVSQNLYLAATSLGLPVCASAGFVDDELDAALGVDGLERASMLAVLIGSAPEGGENRS